MKRYLLLIVMCLLTAALSGGEVRKSYYFHSYDTRQTGEWQTFSLDNTLLAGKTGEPVLPFCAVNLMLPPGEKAVSITVTGEYPVLVPGRFNLYPKQEVRPISLGPDGKFFKNEAVYSSNQPYPEQLYTHLTTSWLNGFAFALSTFTPVVYLPASQTLSFYQKVTVTITTQPDKDSRDALANLSGRENIRHRVHAVAQNQDMMDMYPQPQYKTSGYQILIVTPQDFVTGYQELINYYNTKEQTAQVMTTEDIATNMTGDDLQEKIRNYIIQEYQTNGIEHVILGGDVEQVPYRGFYCYVVSGSGYEDYDIPADLYYSALDGDWNTNDNNKWGEPGEDDLLPEVSVARMPFGNSSEQENMIHKSVSYQDAPIAGEFTDPLLVGEHLYSDPMTWGQDYLELLVGDHTDNGYFTHGIPTESNTFTRLYDTLISPPGNIYNWSSENLLNEINQGHSFIHHSGHSNIDYVMRLSTWDINNQNFSQVNGTTHNYTLLYTHGCLCGAFDNGDCIAEKMVTIDNFLAAGVFNSRYGWFDQGLTEGPSAHLHREFISALYNDTASLQIQEIGAAHMISKIKTAPWVTITNEFEPGAQRWCHYCSNVLGDPAMKIWTEEPNISVSEPPLTLSLSAFPNPATDEVMLRWRSANSGEIYLTLTGITGRVIMAQTYHPETGGNQNIRLDLSDLPSGIYTVRMESDGSVGTFKLVKIGR